MGTFNAVKSGNKRSRGRPSYFERNHFKILLNNNGLMEFVRSGPKFCLYDNPHFSSEIDIFCANARII